MARTFKVLSLLLTYPDEAIREAAPAMAEALKSESLLKGHQRRAVCELIDELETRDLYDLQERYVTLFDRTRSLSLHLFEHIHGESRDRGQALVDLQKLYDNHGLVVAANELPDFLPLFLEFLATRPIDEACALLAEPLHILTVLEERLRKRKSIYAYVLHALVTLAQGKVDADGLAALRACEDDDPDDLEALDRAWADEPVTFGPGDDAACAKTSIMERYATRRVSRRSPPSEGSKP